MNGVSDPYNFLNIMRTFKCIYVNYFNRLRFLAEISTSFQKMHFFDNLRTKIKKANRETRQINPFSSSTFSTLSACNIHFCI